MTARKIAKELPGQGEKEARFLRPQSSSRPPPFPEVEEICFTDNKESSVSTRYILANVTGDFILPTGRIEIL